MVKLLVFNRMFKVELEEFDEHLTAEESAETAEESAETSGESAETSGVL